MTTLLVIAHPAEAQAFTHLPALITGPGKIRATLTLTKQLAENPEITKIVVIGTAGRVNKNIPLGSIVKVTDSCQHDSSLYHHVTYFGGNDHTPRVLIATGDSFITDTTELVQTTQADLVDMETDAYVQVANAHSIPIEVYKYVSDDADSEAENTWDTEIPKISRKLAVFCEEVLNF